MRAVAVFLALIISAAAPCALAQSSQSACHIIVVDITGRAIGDAEIVAKSGSSEHVLGHSDERGAFGPIMLEPLAVFARIGTRVSAPVTLHTGTVQLVVPLALVGSVSAHASAPGHYVNEGSALALVSGDVASSLSYMPNYRSQSEGGSGGQSLDGVPLPLPPAAPGGASQSVLPSDLVSSFTATQVDDGTVTPNFHVLAPTQDHRLAMTAGLNENDGSLLKGELSGTGGKLGYAVAIAGGANGGTLAGQRFADVSGASYDHSSNAAHVDGSLSLAYAVGSTQINAVAIATRSRSADIFTDRPGTISAGIGPGNQTRANSFFSYVMATQSHGAFSYHALISNFSGSSTDDASQALFEDQPIGSVTGFHYGGTYGEVALTHKRGANALTAKASLTSVATTAFSRYLTTSLQDTVRATSGEYMLGLEHGSGANGYGASVDLVQRGSIFPGSTFEARLHARREIAGADVHVAFVHADAQTQQAYAVGAYQLSAPNAADITCAGTATVNGPSRLDRRHPSADTLSTQVEAPFAGGHLGVGGFLAYGRDTLVSATTASALPLPGGYVDAVAGYLSALCPGQTLAPSQLYLRQYVSVPHTIGREFYATYSRRFGDFGATLSYEVYSLQATDVASMDPSFPTTLLVGRQVDGVPLQRGSLLLSHTHGRTLAAIALQYVGANNASHLPAHTTFSLGLREPFGPGALSLSVQNLFGAYEGRFRSPQDAVPYTSSGAPIPTLATPMQRTWSLRYLIPLTAHPS